MSEYASTQCWMLLFRSCWSSSRWRREAGGCVWIGGSGRRERVCVRARARLHVIENIYNNNYNITHFISNKIVLHTLCCKSLVSKPTSVLIFFVLSRWRDFRRVSYWFPFIGVVWRYSGEDFHFPITRGLSGVVWLEAHRSYRALENVASESVVRRSRLGQQTNTDYQSQSGKYRLPLAAVHLWRNYAFFPALRVFCGVRR